MGFQNVNRALMAPVEPPLAHYLFVAMAHASMDKDDPPRYYGSVDWLVMVSRSDKRYVRRVLRGMEKDGWIARDGSHDGRAAWTLHLP